MRSRKACNWFLHLMQAKPPFRKACQHFTSFQSYSRILLPRTSTWPPHSCGDAAAQIWICLDGKLIAVDSEFAPVPRLFRCHVIDQSHCMSASLVQLSALFGSM